MAGKNNKKKMTKIPIIPVWNIKESRRGERMKVSIISENSMLKEQKFYFHYIQQVIP